MAITPRTVVRNPLLLLFFAAFVVGGGVYFFSPCTHSCMYSPPAQKTAVRTVNMATIQAAKTTEGHGWLGVEIQTLTPQRAQYAGVASTGGVLVLGLQDGRPAQVAGFQEYDVITSFNHTRMTSACQLKHAVAATPPGALVPVTVIRQGQVVRLHPTLSEKEGPRGCGEACN